MANKERIVEEAALLMAEHGYDHVTMDKVIERTSVAKSNAYYHYPNKELLGIDVLRFWCDVFTQLDQITFGNNNLSSQARVQAYQDRLITFQKASGYFGDPVSTISSQIGTPQSLELYNHNLRAHKACLTTFIESAPLAGTPGDKLNPKSAAECVHLTILGGLIETRTTKSNTPLLHAFACIDELLMLPDSVNN